MRNRRPLSPVHVSGCRLAAITQPAVCWKIVLHWSGLCPARDAIACRHDSRDVLPPCLAHDSAAHPRHVDELPGGRHGADRHLDQRRTVAVREAAPQCAPAVPPGSVARSAAAPKLSAKRTKSGLARSQAISRLPYCSSWMRRTLPKAPSLNSDRHQRNAVAHRGRQLVRREQKAAVAGDRQHRHIAARVLRAERGGEAPAEIVLVAGRQERARLVDRKGEARGKADLRHLVDEDSVLRQFGADRVEKGRAAARAWRAACAAGLALLHLVAARGPPRIVGRQHVEQAPQDRLRSPISATAGLAKRAGSSGSASTRMIARSSSIPHCCSGECRCVPTASTTSASAHNSWPSGRVTVSGSRLSSTPRPRR